MSLTPKILALTDLGADNYEIKVEIDLPADTDFSLEDRGTDGSTRVFHANMQDGSQSGPTVRTLVFTRSIKDEKAKVITLNLEGDPVGEGEVLFPN